MTWEEICADRRFHDYPGRVETNRQGQIIMSPAKNKHGVFQNRIARWLERLLPTGEALVECAIETSDGVKVADVAWAELAQVRRLMDVPAWNEAPAIVVEVMSASNTPEEMDAKRVLYFAQGASECWLCDDSGSLRFFDRTGEVRRSVRCPDFPSSVAT